MNNVVFGQKRISVSFFLFCDRLLSSCRLIIRPFSLWACHSVWAVTRGGQSDGRILAKPWHFATHADISVKVFFCSSISLSISFCCCPSFFIHLTTSQGWQIACERLNLERLRPHVRFFVLYFARIFLHVVSILCYTWTWSESNLLLTRLMMIFLFFLITNRQSNQWITVNHPQVKLSCLASSCSYFIVIKREN